MQPKTARRTHVKTCIRLPTVKGSVLSGGLRNFIRGIGTDHDLWRCISSRYRVKSIRSRRVTFSDIAPADEKAGGAKWSLVGVWTDQTAIEGIFLSGLTAQPNPNFPTTWICPFVPNWTITVSRNGGSPFVTIIGNTWAIVDFANPPHCGYHFVAYRNNAYEVMTPGTYTFRMSQPASGADVVQMITVQPCLATVPMYSDHNDAYSDNFYTTSYSDHLAAEGDPHYYYNTGIAFRVSRRNELTSTLKRYFIGAPLVDHFYTHIPKEQNDVVGWGWTYENDEGNVFTTAVTGTVPLYRLSKYYPLTGGLEHSFTTSMGTVTTMVSQGWDWDDGVAKGYVCPP